MDVDLSHNPQPRRMHCRLAQRSAEWAHRFYEKRKRTNGYRITAVDLANVLTCAEVIEDLLLELNMARDFLAAAPIVVAAATQAQADNVTLTTANAALTAQVAALTATQQTPDVLAAQQSIIDLGEKLSPSAPPVVPDPAAPVTPAS